MEIQIDNLQPHEVKEVRQLAGTVIKNNFLWGGWDPNSPEYRGGYLGEVMRVQKGLDLDKNPDSHFITAKLGDKIIGIAGYTSKIAEPIKQVVKQQGLPPDTAVELMSFYINPEYQRQGVGSDLLKVLTEHLSQTDFEYFSLYTGYPKGVAFWTKKLGDPTKILENYWEEHNCYVWIKKLSDFPSFLDK